MTEPTLGEVFLLARALGTRPASVVEGVEMMVHGALTKRRTRNGEERTAPVLLSSRPTPANEDTL